MCEVDGMSISEELGRAIQYYCDNHERMGDAWLVCKLNDIVYDCKEAEERIKELEEALQCIVDTSQLKCRGNDKLVKSGLAIHGEPMHYTLTLSSMHRAIELLKGEEQ